MTDIPKIEVGQKWVTRGGEIVRVIATDGRVSQFPVIVENECGSLDVLTDLGRGVDIRCDEPEDLISLAPTTVKREVALYREIGAQRVDAMIYDGEPRLGWLPISEPLTIEFTLLQGETT